MCHALAPLLPCLRVSHLFGRQLLQRHGGEVVAGPVVSSQKQQRGMTEVLANEWEGWAGSPQSDGRTHEAPQITEHPSTYREKDAPEDLRPELLLPHAEPPAHRVNVRHALWSLCIYT
jgi:hypothetical protein